MKKNLLAFFAMAIALVCSTTLSAVELKDRVLGDFTGNMVITITVNDGEPVVNPPASTIVTVTETEGVFGLNLKNFLFIENENPFFVGNIDLDGVIIQKEGDKITINVEKGIAITAGDDDFEYEGYPEPIWLGPEITEACEEIPIILSGIIEGQTAKMTIEIDITEAMGMFISVQFEGTNPDVTLVSNEIASAAGINILASADGSALYVKGLETETAYTIYNVLGSVVASGTVSDVINSSSLAKGVYLIKVGGKTVKFIKKS